MEMGLWLVGDFPVGLLVVLTLTNDPVDALLQLDRGVLVVTKDGLALLHVHEHVSIGVLHEDAVASVGDDAVSVQFPASSYIHADWTVYSPVLGGLVSLSGVVLTFYATVSCPIGL